MFSSDDALRAILLGKRSPSKTVSLDQKLAVSNQASTILNSAIQFVPAKRPYEDDSKELKSKYIRLRVPSTARGMSGRVIKADSCSRNPSTSKSLTLFDFHFVKKKPVPVPTTDNGVPPPMFEIFPVDDVRVNWDSKLRRSTAVGLHNLGNTCFLNSVLQVLTNTAPLVNHLMNNEHDVRKCPSSTGFCALCLTKNHIQRIFSCTNGSAIAPQTVVSRVRCFMKSHSSGRQEDAHEFLRYFIDAMQTAALYAFKGRKLDLYTKETSVIGRIFGGYHKNEVICNKCHFNSTTYDPFLDLSVEVKQSQTLEAALTHFTRPETLANEDAYKCPRCKMRVSARKMFTIHQAPNVLAIQLKRFDHSGKIDRFIAYPEKLSLRPYMTEKQGPPVNYKLYGVVVHHGRSTRSGHYYAFVRNPCDQWHVLDDSRAASVSPNSALKSSSAYLLFYIRTPTPIIAVKPQVHPRAAANGVSPKRTGQWAAAQPMLKMTPRLITDVTGEHDSDEKGEGRTSNQALTAEAFAKGDVVDEFRAEFEADIDRDDQEAVANIEAQLTLPGRNSCSGSGMENPKADRRRRERLEKVKKKREKLKKLKKLKKKLKNWALVKLNRAATFEIVPEVQVSHRPFLFRSTKDFEANLEPPLGTERDPEAACRSLIDPNVETRTDAVIKPIGEELASKKTSEEEKEKRRRRKRAKRKSGDDEEANNGDPRKKSKSSVDEVGDGLKMLEKQHGFGYGCSVKSWDGSLNLVDRYRDTIEDETSNDGGDEWNEEYDRGKVKKRKKKQGQFMLMGMNPFQSVQNSKNRWEQSRRMVA